MLSNLRTSYHFRPTKLQECRWACPRVSYISKPQTPKPGKKTGNRDEARVKELLPWPVLLLLPAPGICHDCGSSNRSLQRELHWGALFDMILCPGEDESLGVERTSLVCSETSQHCRLFCQCPAHAATRLRQGVHHLKLTRGSRARDN